jgi:hypothetical protein
MTETPITSGVVTPGSSAPLHITVWDQTTLNEIPPGDVTWVLDPSLSAVVVAPDSVGFNFSAPAGTPDATGNATATYTLASGVMGVLALAVQITVTGLTFTSP